MLKDRITITEKGFQIQEDADNHGRVAYFSTFSLKEEKINKDNKQKLSYYTVLNTVTQMLENRTFVCVWEEKDDKLIEEHWFYYSTAGSKPRLQWSIGRAKPYGEFAYMITLKWKDHIYDSIHKSHIWLKHKKSNSKFPFLRETISPLDPAASELSDCYIIEMPPGVEPEDLVIEGDELLQKKYSLIGV